MDKKTKKQVVDLHSEHPDWSEQHIADELGLTRSSVWRVLSKLQDYSVIDTTGWTELELQQFEEFKVFKKKNAQNKKKNIFLRIIPLKRTSVDPEPGAFDSLDYSYGDAIRHKNNFLENYIPQNQIQPLDVEINQGKIISQAPFVAGKKDNGQVLFPKFFINPLNALDMIVLQDVYMHTICGSIIDILTSFTVGKGVRPTLKLNSENIEDIKKIKIQKNDETEGSQQTSEKGEEGSPLQEDETKEELQARVLDENKWLLDPLIAIDDSFSDPKQTDPFLDETWNDKVEALIRNHWIFGRDMLTYEYFDDKIFVWNDKKFPDIPNVVKVIHPRDIGFVQPDQPTQKLAAVSLMFSNNMIEANDMLYLEHVQNSPIYNAKYFGYSKMMRMLGDGRSLRKLKDRDFPNVASIGYAGFSIIAFGADTKGSDQELSQNTAFVNNMTVGAPNAISLEDPEHGMKVHDVNTNPQIREMIEMAQYHAEAAAKSAEVPTTLVSKEKDPNRDTLLGVLRLFKENVIRNHQSKIGKVLDAQWYMKNWRIIYKDNKDVLKNFHVECEFEDIKLESWDDLVSSVVELSKLNPLKAEALGELLGIANYQSKIDPEGKPLQDTSTMIDNEGNEITTTKKPAKKPKQ